jgi:hypothetical protein
VVNARDCLPETEDTLETDAAVERPKTRVLFVSGYSELPHEEGTAAELSPETYLQKPFTPTGLIEPVSRALGGG